MKFRQSEAKTARRIGMFTSHLVPFFVFDKIFNGFSRTAEANTFFELWRADFFRQGQSCLSEIRHSGEIIYRQTMSGLKFAHLEVSDIKFICFCVYLGCILFYPYF